MPGAGGDAPSRPRRAAAAAWPDRPAQQPGIVDRAHRRKCGRAGAAAALGAQRRRRRAHAAGNQVVSADQTPPPPGAAELEFSHSLPTPSAPAAGDGCVAADQCQPGKAQRVQRARHCDVAPRARYRTVATAVEGLRPSAGLFLQLLGGRGKVQGRCCSR
eukprot:362930-Chlamydomonas_euryale.AAC.9